jgi:hypothetical protein
MSLDANARRPMSTIIELSAEKAHTSRKDSNFDQELRRTSLTPLVHGKD